MKRLTLMFAALAALTGCLQPTPPDPAKPNPSPVEVVAGRVIVEGTRGLILAELTYQSVAQAALAATKAGIIKGSAATLARDLNRKATTAIIAGQSASTAAEKAQHAATILSSVSGLCKLGIPDRFCAPFRR